MISSKLDENGIPFLKYRCLQCGHKWEIDMAFVICPQCEHTFVKWENVEEVLSACNKR